MHKKLNEITEMKDKLICMAKDEIGKGYFENAAHVEMVGEVVDMIKDLAEAEKECMEACYYKEMLEGSDYEDEQRMGYNGRRYANGEYAPAGRGHVTGYHPPMMGNRRGYVELDRDMMGDRSEYGRPFDEFRQAKRHYTETKSEDDKKKMKDRANEHISNSITTIREIWSFADPELKQKMKHDMTNLVNDMNM